MSDLREIEPAERLLDFDRETTGNGRFGAEIFVWPYSSLQNEKVYSRKVVVHFRAENMREAHGFAQCISATISHAHDVWQTGISKIWARG